MKRDFVSIEDFSNDEVEVLFVIADKMHALIRQCHGVLPGHIMGSLFLEPSTRTRLSFEAAMNRLGGRVLTIADVGASSMSKGETLADSVRIVSSYTDILVLRHPQAGAARLAAAYAPIPVINAGDGGHEHPTQTLCDLYALRKTKGRLNGLRVILYGDLKYGRTTHSLALALGRFGSDVLCIAEPGLELPNYVRERCAAIPGNNEYEVELSGAESAFGRGARRGLLFSHAPEAWALSDGRLHLDQVDCDAIYVTRLQKERLSTEDEKRANSLPPVDVRFLEHRAFGAAVVLHPLPRVSEIDYAVDSDPRGFYFQQAELGVPVRMALISFLLGREAMRVEPPEPRQERTWAGQPCRNSSCVLATATYQEPRAWTSADGRHRCAFCDHEFV